MVASKRLALKRDPAEGKSLKKHQQLIFKSKVFRVDGAKRIDEVLEKKMTEVGREEGGGKKIKKETMMEGRKEEERERRKAGKKSIKAIPL